MDARKPTPERFPLKPHFGGLSPDKAEPGLLRNENR
jgi:hypothetical protein